MTQWAEPGRKYTEGHYTFRIEKEPVFEPFSYLNKKSGQFQQGKRVVLSLLAMSDEVEFTFEEKIPVWDDRYTALLKALNIEHLVQDGADVEVAGEKFEGELKYVADPKRPGRSWPHIVNIKVPEEERKTTADDEVPLGEDDIPF